ncbi:hypothetical protein [Streptomyces anulatus]|uniref:hypothetical protein n=1 Tax=Streptomyces anulatus TaxID=1892 RepID=UPI0020B860EA|nr:hypothetical protein [Streptomyces anulatus]
MSGKNEVEEFQRRLDGLRALYGPAHDDVVACATQLAELTGEQGDIRSACRLYRELGDALREHVGPFDVRTLDAYEGVARWIARS